ncbi:hypothetical protein [Chitinimonas koreensis]|uniref:hypothetical protein n=1 Tax=Chitinimonas koreensis TaxID=356302 RepID=UPI00048AAE5E|nr:hypothetical protein [Chitinimonas koreensis]QNM96362.1 hypothetical protein H9L41_21640 [Chitinimonas koreensis]
MPLVLNVPEPISGRPLSVETNPKAVKAWLVSLPPANLLETGRAIFDALTTLNRVKLDADARLALLEHYQVAIDLLDAPLEAAYSSAHAPARDKARQASTLARNLQLELANGYKLVLNERLNARFSLGNRQLPELIQKLMANHFKLMWVCCKSYTAVPAGAWQEVHALFRHAVQHKWIDAPESADHPIRTIGGYYKQMLLLALSDPFRYHPVEHDKILDLIRNYGAAAQFQPLGAAQHPAGLFLVRLDADVAPAFLGQKPLDADASGAILLDTMEMARHLHKALHAVEAKLPGASDRAKAQAWIDLLRRVTRQWSIAPKRVFQRIRANSRVEVAGGLRLAAYYLNGARPLLQPVVLDDAVVDDIGPISVSGSSFTAPDDWMVLNESPGGFALRLKPAPQNGLYRVGDLIALRAHGQDAWLVACVRWLQTVDEGEALEVGAQVLAPGGTAAMMRPTIAHQGSTFQPCLLLPEVAALKQPPLIAAPRGSFSPMREMAIYTDDGEQIVRAAKLHEQAVGFDLFEYNDNTAGR